MTHTLFVDIETRSRVNLKKSNVYRYTEDPDFKILMAAWAVDEGPIEVSFDYDIGSIPGLTDRDWVRVAHNAAFERICFSRYLKLPTGMYLPSRDWTDTAVLAAEAGYPRSLENAAKALGAEEKDSAGTRLINLFCVPNRKGEFNQPEDFPEEWQRFIAYCKQDVGTLRDIYRRLPQEFPTLMEEEAYHADQAVNDRGIAVDLDMVKMAKEAADDNQLELEMTVSARTGIKNPGSSQQLSAYMSSVGLEMPDWKAETVEEYLARKDLTDDQRYVLEARRELALSASAKYAAALLNVCSDGRLRGAFLFHGAHTGRWTGRGVQLQNLPRASLDSVQAVEAAILDLKMGEGGSPHTLKALVRAMFTGPMTVADYASIEARVVAWLAGEQWVLDAAVAGRDLYVETAQRMGGLSRREGKVAVLALGYNGGIQSLKNMGAEDSDERLKFLVKQWREANPKICDFWGRLDDAFWIGGKVGKIRVERSGDDRRVILPSGRSVTYHGVKARWQERNGRQVRRMSYISPTNGFRTETYGGKLTENVTQAVARDVLAEAMVRLEAMGYEVLGHIHDEVLVAGDDLPGVSEIMNQAPGWAKGLPIASAGFCAARYRKD